MLKRLYSTVALFVLPSIEETVGVVHRQAAILDSVTGHLETHLEDKAVALAKAAQQRRSIVEIVRTAVDHVIDSIHAAFDRREAAVVADVEALQAKIAKAVHARASVQNFLNATGATPQ